MGEHNVVSDESYPLPRRRGRRSLAAQRNRRRSVEYTGMGGSLLSRFWILSLKDVFWRIKASPALPFDRMEGSSRVIGPSFRLGEATYGASRRRSKKSDSVASCAATLRSMSSTARKILKRPLQREQDRLPRLSPQQPRTQNFEGDAAARPSLFYSLQRAAMLQADDAATAVFARCTKLSRAACAVGSPNSCAVARLPLERLAMASASVTPRF